MIVDKAEVRCRFRKSIGSYDDNAYVQKIIVNRLFDLLKLYQKQFPHKVLEIGCGTGLLSDLLVNKLIPDLLIVNDLVEEMCEKTLSKFPGRAISSLPGDIEELSLAGKYDLIVSASTFQWFINPAETLKKLSRHLEPGGLMAYSTFGKKNLYELREVAGGGLYYPAKEEVKEMLACHFDILHVEESCHILHFPEPLDVLQHVKKTGVNATSATAIWTKASIVHFAEKYIRLFGEEEGVPLTYQPLYIICRKK